MKTTTKLILTILASALVIIPMPIMAKDNNNKVTTIHLTKSEFLEKVYNYENNPEEAKYEGDKPALIDFYAVWCGPCKSLAPVLEELAEEYAGEIYIYKVDCEQEREIASYIGVRAYPTLLFIPMEGQPTMAQGALPKAELKSAINTILLKKEN